MRTKIYLITLFAVTVGMLWSCDDSVYDHVAQPPQTSEQEELQETTGFKFALGDQLTSAIVLSEKQLDGATLSAVKTTSTGKLSEGASIDFALRLSNAESFENAVNLSSTTENGVATITANDLNEAVKTLYGKAPYERELYLEVLSYIKEGEQKILLPEKTVLGPIKVTPVGPVIETEYYLIGDANEWNFDNLGDYKFSHSGRDVYEDPIFTLLANNIEGNFKIVPKSCKDAGSWDGVLGNPIDQNPALSGELVGGGAMRIEAPGWVKITLNMMEYTYNIEVIGEMNLTLYVAGSHQGWDPGTAPTVYCRNFDFKYDGYVYFDGPHAFKFTSQPNWDGINYGDGGSEGVLTDDGSAGNLNVTEAGYYRLNVDLSGSPHTYTAEKTEWGLIGDATEGGWDNSTPMTYDPDTRVWSVTTTLEGGKSFKFRANNAWTINLGGDMDNLSYDGANIDVVESGTYWITLNLSNPTAYKAKMMR